MVEGMNSFCAAVILKCCSLNEFLDMTYEQRVDNLGHLVDPMRLVSLSFRALRENSLEISSPPEPCQRCASKPYGSYGNAGLAVIL